MEEQRTFRKNLLSNELKKVSEVIGENGILKNERSCYVVSESEMLEAIHDLKDSFPPNSKHCFALKSFPIPGVLKIFGDHGFGQEAASFEELQIALKAGTSVEDIVYDSPCKSVKEIEWCFSHDIFLLNADNLDEVERMKNTHEKFPQSKTMCGLRINPQIGIGNLEGSQAATSTASSNSKFGIPYKEIGFARLLSTVKSLPRIQALHVHVGSGGMSCGQLVQGCRIILELANRLNKELGRKQITHLDFGGGFPIPQNWEDEIILFKEFWNELKKLDGIENYTIVTEHGRGLFHRAGIAISRVEYVKFSGGYQIAILRFGENLFVFNVVSEGRIFPVKNPIFLNPDGSWKNMEEEKLKRMEDPKFTNLHGLNLVGPICFSGDIICRKLDVLPSLKSEDVIMFPCSGVYTLSHYSKFNSISMCPIHMLQKDGTMKCIKKKESIEKVVNFWFDE